MSDDQSIDEKRRRFLVASACALGGFGAACALKPFAASWMPSAKTNALNEPVQVDLSDLAPGQYKTVEWRAKPVLIMRRTPQMLAELEQNNTLLRDPNSRVDQQPAYARNNHRSIKPEYLVLINVCTHLGCAPIVHVTPNQELYCPCHASRFDLAGRVFKGMPAPINLAVPPHYFPHEHCVIIGKEAHA